MKQTLYVLRFTFYPSQWSRRMAKYIAKRVLYMIPTLFVISLISFTIIQLPPGDFLTTYVATLRQQGEDLDTQAIQALEDQYGLNQPIYVQYGKWIGGIL